MDSPATDIRVLRAIRRIIRAVDLHSKTLQQAQDITAPQLVCLLTLVRQGACTVKALSAAIDLSPSTTVGVVDRLAAKGLAERTRSTSDRRQVLVSATAAGRALAQRSPSPLQDRLVARLGALPPAEQLSLAQALERLVGLMGADAIDASAILDLAPIAEAAPAAETPATEAPTGRLAADTAPGRVPPSAAPPATPLTGLGGGAADDQLSRLGPPAGPLPPPAPDRGTPAPARPPGRGPLVRQTVIGAWPGDGQ